jgi:hypothetical protein
MTGGPRLTVRERERNGRARTWEMGRRKGTRMRGRWRERGDLGRIGLAERGRCFYLFFLFKYEYVCVSEV